MRELVPELKVRAPEPSGEFLIQNTSFAGRRRIGANALMKPIGVSGRFWHEQLRRRQRLR